MILNKYVVKLCLEHEVRRGNKVVKKELIVALKGEIYFVKFIINPEEDDVKPEVNFGRSFLCMTKAVTDFGAGTFTIYPDIDPFLEETEAKEKSNEDWDNLFDFNIDDIPLLGEEGLSPFVCKMGKSSRNKKRAMENLNFFFQDIGTSSSVGGHLTQEEAGKEALAIRMSQKFALLEEERPITETMAYHDKYKKELNEVWKDKVELDGKIVKEEEEAVKRIKGEALKEKDDPGAFIFPIRLEGQVNENALADIGSDINTMPCRIYEQLGREDIKKVDKGITMINHTLAEAMGILTNVLYQVGVTTLIAKFLILDIPIDCDSLIVVGRGFLRTIGCIVNTPKRLFSTFNGFCHQTFRAVRSNVMRNAESDSDDEEDYQIKRNKFGAPVYGPKPAPYLNCNDLAERSLAIQTVTNPFRKISVWKKAVSFLGSLPVPLKSLIGRLIIRTMGTHDDEVRSSRSKCSKQHETVEEVLLPQVHHKFLLWEGCNKDSKSRMDCDGEIDDMLRIRLREAGSDEELCHEFYSSYEFDKVFADGELKTKKIIKFRLGGHAHSVTLLEFARRLGLYQAVKLEEEGFNVYFEGGLRSDEHFNAQDYWLSISREENLSLSRSHTSTIKNPILRVIHKMITYGLCQRMTGYDKIQKNGLWLLSMFDARHQNGYANVAWLIARWMKRKGAGTQKERQICCGQFISKIARKCRVLTEYVVRSLSAPIYYRDMDMITLRDLIDSESKLIPEDPQPGVPRVGIPRPPRASMQDLYDRMGRIEIRQEAID
ncbi:ribonuclease H-like domain-containing protein [Tanacetum coccineum]